MSSDSSSSLSDLLQTLIATVQAAETERNSLRKEAASLREEVKNLRAQLGTRNAEATAACEAIISAVRVLNPSDSSPSRRASTPPAAACTPIFGTSLVDGKESAQSMSRSKPFVNPFNKDTSISSTSAKADGRDASPLSGVSASVTHASEGFRGEPGSGQPRRGARPMFPSPDLAGDHRTSATRISPSFQFGANASPLTSHSKSVAANSCKDQTTLPTALTAPFKLDAGTSTTSPKSATDAGDKKSTEVSFTTGQSPKAAHRKSMPGFHFGASFASSRNSSAAVTSAPLSPNSISLPNKLNTPRGETVRMSKPDESGSKKVSPKHPTPQPGAPNSTTNETARGQPSSKPVRMESAVVTDPTSKNDHVNTSLPLVAAQPAKSCTPSPIPSSTLPTPRSKVNQSIDASSSLSPTSPSPFVASGPRKAPVGVNAHAAQPTVSADIENKTKANLGTRLSDRVSVNDNYGNRAIWAANRTRHIGKVESTTVANGVVQPNRNTNASKDSTANTTPVATLKKGSDSGASNDSSSLKGGRNFRNRSVTKKPLEWRTVTKVKGNTRPDTPKHSASQKSSAAAL